MADNALKVAAENKIRELEKEEDRLNAQLRSKQSFHSSAWAEYGSELCAGGMLKEEQNIYLEMNAVSSRIALLRKFIDGRLDISREGRLKKNSAEVAGQIATLQSSKELIDGELSEIARLKSILAGTF